MNLRVENWFAEQKEEYRNVFLQVRELILNTHPAIEERFTYGTPFYHLHGLLCYLTFNKKHQRPVLGLCDGALLTDEHGLLLAEDGQTQIRHLSLEKRENARGGNRGWLFSRSRNFERKNQKKLIKS